MYRTTISSLNALDPEEERLSQKKDAPISAQTQSMVSREGM